MGASHFELFMCCLGNGTTLCNKAVTECGDYKTIGHISNAGNVKLYVKPDYIPEKDMQTIRRVATQDRNRFIDRLELELRHNPGAVYEQMLDCLTTAEFLEHTSKRGRGLENAIRSLMPVFIERS